MIAQLYASRPKGTKSFENRGIQFGWASIQEVYHWNLKQAKAGSPLPVPGLKLSHIVRDSWTRLNVKPAKIMQQQQMIAALKILADRATRPGAKASIDMTTQYLEACNAIFETGMLSNNFVKMHDQSVVENVKKGQLFFERWLSALLQEYDNYKPNDVKQKLFLAWQTWDLLRIVSYGIIRLTEEFFSKYGSDFVIAPKRLNGSAIETLFSQFKHLTGGKLSATNYATARAAYLMKVDIHGRHFGEKDYRNVDLYIRQCELSM